MKILYTKQFVRMLEHLPENIRELYFKQETYFEIEWRDSRLHTKRLHGTPTLFSFRVTRKYRVLFNLVEPDTALFSAIGNRKDIYR